jgi:hypothetical protein
MNSRSPHRGRSVEHGNLAEALGDPAQGDAGHGAILSQSIDPEEALSRGVNRAFLYFGLGIQELTVDPSFWKNLSGALAYLLAWKLKKQHMLNFLAVHSGPTTGGAAR